MRWRLAPASDVAVAWEIQPPLLMVRRNGSASSSRAGVHDDDFVEDDNARTPSQSTKRTPNASYAAAALHGSDSRGKHPITHRETKDTGQGKPGNNPPIADDVSDIENVDAKEPVKGEPETMPKRDTPSLLDRASSMAESIRATIGGGSSTAESIEKPKAEPDATDNGSERVASKPIRRRRWK